MDVDILKPDTGAVQIERPVHSSRGTSSSERHGSGSSGIATPELGTRNPYAEPVSEGEEDEDMSDMVEVVMSGCS